MEPMKTVGVALVGCGTVGSGVAKLLVRDGELLAQRGGVRLSLNHVVDLDFSRARQAGVPEAVCHKDLDKALTDADTAIVVELVGGTTFAQDVVRRALRAGKHVVTANKALLAHHGRELYALAREHGASIAFEASCVGGVPVIGALTRGLLANRIEAMYGIVNGTCNFILSAMTDQGAPYASVLAEAQADGLAEADPTLDVSGEDSAHKLAILAGLAFGHSIDYTRVPFTGIDTLDLADIHYGRELGYTVKLLAIAERYKTGLSLRVRPAFLHSDHPLAQVSGPFNAVSIYGHATGHTLYYGRGAGSMPTASAVMADVLSVALGDWPMRFEQLGLWPDRCAPAEQLPPEQIVSRYYLRATIEDAPGVLARIASVLGDHEISITSVLQHEPRGKADGVPLVITTHEATEGNIRNACAEMDQFDVVKAPTIVIPILEEHPEPEL